MSHQPTDFERAAQENQEGNIVTEFIGFLSENKKWWLAPIVAIMLLFGVLILLAGTGAAPFIYTLF